MVAKKTSKKKPARTTALTEKKALEKLQTRNVTSKPSSAKTECTPIKASGVKVLLAGIVFAIIAQIIHSIGAFATMGYYLTEEYFPVWSKIMMPAAGSPPASFFMYSMGAGLIVGVLFALVFSLLACCIGGSDKTKRGLTFGFAVFLVGGIPFILSMFLLINLPAGLLVAWAFEQLIICLIGGVAVAHIVK
ncbi:MAG: hypothetical protein ABIF08_03610 [Nanoarchaeota archaeon]